MTKKYKRKEICISSGIPGTPCDAANCNGGCIQLADQEERWKKIKDNFKATSKCHDSIRKALKEAWRP